MPNQETQNTPREGKLQMRGKIGSEQHQTSREEENFFFKKRSQKNKKTSGNQALQQESYQRDKHPGCPFYLIRGTILEIDGRKNSDK